MDRGTLTIGPGQTLADVAFEAMHKLISDGTWAPRMRLPSETDLVRQLNISRPVIRQALSRLREMGLIQSRQGSGSFVCEVPGGRSLEARVQFPPITNLAELTAFLFYREGVEGESAATAARRHTEALFQDLLGSLDAISGEATAPSDYAFHLAIARASNNPFYVNALTAVKEQILFGLNLEWGFSGSQPSFRRTVDEQHRAIVDAIRERDGEAARSLMRAHLSWGRAKLTGEDSTDLVR